MKPRVVVTGMGVVSPFGYLETDEYWNGIVKGTPNFREITMFPLTAKHKTRIAGEVDGFPAEKYISSELRKRIGKLGVPNGGRSIYYGLRACQMALEDSGLDLDNEDKDRIGIFTGTLRGDNSLISEGSPSLTWTFYSIPGSLTSCIVAENNIQNCSFGISSAACATGNVNIEMAYDNIVFGKIDCGIAGSSSAHLSVPHPFDDLSGRISPMSRSTDTYPMKPFDVRRDGFIISEGSGMLIIEELGHAQKRNAKIYAEVLGCGSVLSVSGHFADVSRDGYSAAMTKALYNSGISDSDLQKKEVYVCSHGTATQKNSIEESHAVEKVFDGNCCRPFVSSIKGSLGHSQEASSAQESVASVYVLNRNIIPVTGGLEEVDPECANLNYVMSNSIEQEVDLVLNNAAGFGGIYSTIVFGKYRE